MPTGNDLLLYLNIKGLAGGCSHSHAMPASNFRKLSGLRASKHAFFLRDAGNYTFFGTGKYTSIGEYSPVVWLDGNRTLLGTVAQVSNGFCSDVYSNRLCVRRKSNRNHEVARYHRLTSGYSTYYTKTYNFSVEGELSNTDALEIAIQGHAAIMTRDQISGDSFDSETQKLVANFIERGRVLSGFVRVAGKGVPGKSVVRRVETATINVLGVVGAAIVLVLVLMPIPIILKYGKGIVSNVESSYKRAVMKSDGVESYLEVPRTAPSICAKEIDNRNLVSITHTFTT